MEKVRDAILAWESEVRRYTDLSGKTMDEDDKIGALIQIIPSQVQNHVRLNPERPETYDSLRQLIFSYAAAMEEAKAVPMETNSFEKSQQKNIPSRGSPSGAKPGSKGSYGGFQGYTNYRPAWKGGKSKGKGKSIVWSSNGVHTQSSKGSKGKGKSKSTKGGKGGKGGKSGQIRCF